MELQSRAEVINSICRCFDWKVDSQQQQKQEQLDAQMRSLGTLMRQLNIHCWSSYAISDTSCYAVARSILAFINDPSKVEIPSSRCSSVGEIHLG
ncbi:unnamed protein product [Schistosoma mattheei]|uniref:Uncharacterized protein n=1 Tax=Schistosoma mattheei TaxID=31246 RepID=A0A183PP63_9TREM|nr:unnamed protein product [Schistosoma mattheei]